MDIEFCAPFQTSLDVVEIENRLPSLKFRFTLKEDAAAIGAQYVVALGEPYGFGGYQQYGPSVSIKVRLYDAGSGEYRGYAEDSYPISLRDYSNRGPAADGLRIAADMAQKLARTMRKRCTEAYPYQCSKTGLFRLAEPRDPYGK